MSLTNKPSLQAVVTDQAELSPNKGALKLALFNADGTPFGTSKSTTSAKALKDLTARVEALEKASE